MENYRVALGHDQAEISLVRLVPQPRGTGVMPVDRKYAINGAASDGDLYIILRFDMIESEADYLSLLGQFGLDNALTSEVTIKARNDFFVEHRYNGIAHRPQVAEDVEWEDFFVRGVSLYVTHLELLD